MRTGLAWVRWAVGICLLLALIALVDVRAVGRRLAELDPSWIAATIACILAATLIGAFNAHLLVSRGGELTMRRFLPLYWVAWAIGLVVPGQVGDVAGMSVMLRRHDFDWHASIGRSLLDKAVSAGVMLAFAIGGIALLWSPGSLSLASPWQWIAAIATGALATGVALRWLWAHTGASSPGLRGVAARTLREMLETSRRHPRRLGANLALTVVKTMLTGLAYYCVFRALSMHDLSPWAVTLVAAGSSIVAYLPVSFNGMGTVEAAGIALFGRMGVPPDAVLSAYLALRGIVLLLAWCPAAALMLSGRQPADRPLR